MWRTFMAVLALTVLAELLVEKQLHFAVEGFFGVHALFGFAACALLIVVAKAIGVALKRPDDYYEDHD
jgi:hypothetical protein